LGVRVNVNGYRLGYGREMAVWPFRGNMAYKRLP